MRKTHPFLLVFIIFLASCAQLTNSQNDQDIAKKTEKQRSMETKIENKDYRLPKDSPLLKGEGGFNLQDMLGFETAAENYSVNSILFSVALDKIDFMPLLSVDANSGVIVTDWYSFDAGETRIKINIRVLNEELNDDSLNVNLFKQMYENNIWVDKGIDTEQAKKIKKNILSTARSLKIASEL
jgi:hypothetical protein|tara:strand:- start:926 stop:1474 length:549 start_codon:yes stop_codon:yes gene_type:complete